MSLKQALSTLTELSLPTTETSTQIVDLIWNATSSWLESTVSRKTRSRRELPQAQTQPKPFLNIIDDNIVKPMQFAADEFMKVFPSAAIDEMLFYHQYLNFTPIWGLDYENFDEFFTLPSEELEELYIAGETMVADFPHFLEHAQTTAEDLQEDLRFYMASLSPWLEFLQPETQPLIDGSQLKESYPYDLEGNPQPQQYEEPQYYYDNEV